MINEYGRFKCMEDNDKMILSTTTGEMARRLGDEEAISSKRL